MSVANFTVFGSILGFYEFHFSTSALFIARRISPSTFFFLEDGWGLSWLFFRCSCFLFHF